MDKRNVYVLGLDEFNLQKLESLPASSSMTFHEVLSYEESHGAMEYHPLRLLDKARRRLDAVSSRRDAIVGFWDFPVSLLMAVLGESYGTRAGSLDAVLQCEHKYWSRLKQREAVPDLTPAFELVDPFDKRAFSKMGLAPPFWLKPIKSFAAHLGFLVENENDFHKAISVLRKEIHRFGEPFNEILSLWKANGHLPQIDGHHAVAEAIIDGEQCTVEGWVLDGQVNVHGIIDSHRFPNKVSFSRYEYPSKLPKNVRARMIDATERLIEHIGLDNQTFNVEFYYDASRDTLWLLEINPRCSQSHADLFEKVDGAPNQEVTVSVGLGRRPSMQPGAGPYGVAAKFFLRYMGDDARVTHVPDISDIRRIRARFPGTRIFFRLRVGDLLSSRPYQDSYSYQLAFVYMGASDQAELLENWEQCQKMLQFGLEPIGRRPDPEEGGIRADTSRKSEARP